MFFSPTVQALTRPELGNHVKILCLSTGDSEGLGATRKLELEAAAVLLGLRRKEDIFVMNDNRFKDGMKEQWSEKEIARVLAQAFAPHLIPSNTAQQHARTSSGVDLDQKHRRTLSNITSKNVSAPAQDKGSYIASSAITSTTPGSRMAPQLQNDGPHASIDVLLTFDTSGISGHPNHKSLYHGSKVFLQQMMKGYAGYNCPVALYTLTTTNIVRKYSFILDVLPTYAIKAFAGMFGSKHGTASKSMTRDDRVVFVSNFSKYMIARKAMVKGHVSQMIWFRWGWISLGRYMVINDIQREYVSGS